MASRDRGDHVGREGAPHHGEAVLVELAGLRLVRARNGPVWSTHVKPSLNSCGVRMAGTSVVAIVRF